MNLREGRAYGNALVFLQSDGPPIHVELHPIALAAMPPGLILPPFA